MIKLPNKDGLNVVPFIDIMLVLLAIVLSIATFIEYGRISVDLPQSNSSQNNEKKEKIIITIDSNNNFFINDTLSNIKDINQKISSIPKQTLIELKSDKNSKFESFIQIINILKNNKHDNFYIITEYKNNDT